ncbi:TPA: alpha/beta hydrolase [Candidatus Dependentiae bacterium]|nr:MAG: hypothetical protein UR14_C0001G0117 [candidate division TM6 bacterium GW2011_GWE2_31_21]KKP54003.1 MAG: hypothetical protein UR43_C0001G0021 [candidate division TM6 bacterium GW2011_GWF2_33_332]HBS48416.1 alpha/beta hydrolase [Candidatus Dependentiae bacterium]HBZ72910.1 alpha/beta hydrolase [Candidatus Dependentiae bacterium]
MSNKDTRQLNFYQEPKPPFPYSIEEVSYQNEKAKVNLSGSLTMPNQTGHFPAVILVAGLGPHDRDNNMMGHKRFLVLADYLTRNGIAVLRFDKRGVGKSTGDYAVATSRDFADDVIAGIKYLKTRKEIDPNKIGLIGHSEGGMIACMLAAESKDVAFLVSMAGVVQTDVDDLVMQTAKQLKADGASEELLAQDHKLRMQILTIVKQELNIEVAKVKLQKLMNDYCAQLPENLKKESDNIPFAITKSKIDSMVEAFNSSWYRYFLNCNTAEMLKKIVVPVLALNGDRDWIVSSNPSLEITSDSLKAAGNLDYKTVELHNLNHTFQTCKTGSLAEYGTIEETIAPEALKIILDWILAKTNKEFLI